MGTHKGKHRKTDDAPSEGTGTEQGLREDSGLQDQAAADGTDTADHLQDTSAAKRPDG